MKSAEKGNNNGKKWLYKVENDKISVLLSLIVTVIFAAVTAVLHGFIITLVFTIVMAALTLCSAYRFIFIKLLIGEDSFAIANHLGIKGIQVHRYIRSLGKHR